MSRNLSVYLDDESMVKIEDIKNNYKQKGFASSYSRVINDSIKFYYSHIEKDIDIKKNKS